MMCALDVCPDVAHIQNGSSLETNPLRGGKKFVES